MKKQTNALMYVFLFIFVSVNVFLHRNGGPLYPLVKHSLAYSTQSTERVIVHSDGKNINNKQAHKIKKNKLRVRYKGSDVRFTITFLTPIFITPRNFRRYHYAQPEDLYLFQPRLFSSQRGPPAYV